MATFEWDKAKEKANIEKHGVSFNDAKQVFGDPDLKIDVDEKHSETEKRYHAYGLVDGHVMTVRFTYRDDGAIRIFGAAYWRKGKKLYEKERQ